MKCEDCLFYYDDYVDEKLGASGILEISEHLAVCESCAFSYREFGREQEIFERHLLKAEATPALWENLQAAIKNEKIVSPPAPAKTIGGELREIFDNFNLLFSTRGVVFSGLAVVAVCAIIFSLAGRKNNPTEYADNDREISPVARLNESIINQPSLKAGTEKNVSQVGQNKLLLTTTSKQSKAARIKPSTERANPVPRKNTKPEKPETAAAHNKSGKELLPGEHKYLEIIASLTEEVKSIEPAMPKVLSDDYRRNLSAVDKAIEETRKSARRHPKNRDVMNFVFSAYQGKIVLLSGVAKQDQ